MCKKNFLQGQLFMKVVGQGGTGKSRFINAMKELALALNRPKAVKIMSFLGVAAVLAGGTTVHSALRIPVGGRDYSQSSSENLRKEFEDVEIIIIDEISLTGKNLFRKINRTLSDAFSMVGKPYGGKHMILVGDHQQFDPVGDIALNAEGTPETNDVDMLLSEFRTVVLLKHNNRTSLDQTLASDLYALRTREFFDDVKAMEDFIKRFNRHEIGNNPVPIGLNATWLVATNIRRREIIDDHIRAAESRGAKIVEFDCDGIQRKPGKPSEPLEKNVRLLIVKESYDSTSPMKSLKSHPSPKFYVGMPVAITMNPSRVHQQYGIATGAHGVVAGFQMVTTSPIPECIFIHFETPAPFKVSNLPAGILPVTTMRFTGSMKLRNDAVIKYSFSGFPIRERFASTYHSMQCLTAKQVVLELPKEIKGDLRKALYMGLSRVQTWDSVRTSSPLTMQALSAFRPPDRDCEFTENLANAATATRNFFRALDHFFYTQNY